MGVGHAGHGDVVEADDTHLVRHADAAVGQPAENTESHPVIEGDDRSHFGSDGEIGGLLTGLKMRCEGAELDDLKPLATRAGSQPASALAVRP
jgi:hypothetical protein